MARAMNAGMAIQMAAAGSASSTTAAVQVLTIEIQTGARRPGRAVSALVAVVVIALLHRRAGSQTELGGDTALAVSVPVMEDTLE
jgi:hypothetical protein